MGKAPEYYLTSQIAFNTQIEITTWVQWWDSSGSYRFYRTVSGNFTRTANRLAWLLILVPLVETELADNI